MIDTLITDRTWADVLRARELAIRAYHELAPAEQLEWDSNLKGRYNASDMNRVEEVIQFIISLFQAYDIPTPTPPIPQRTWTDSDAPTYGELQGYLQKVIDIRQAWLVMATTPQVPSTINNLLYTGANDIEQILFDVLLRIHAMEAAFRVSGNTWSGLEGIINVR
jgi:hypothetical protein